MSRLLLRIPEAWARKWGMRATTFQAVFTVAYLVVWLGLGLRSWFDTHTSPAFASWLGLLWLPTFIVAVFLQSVVMAHRFVKTEAQLLEWEKAHEQLMVAMRVRAQAEQEELARILGHLPPERPVLQ